MQSNKSYDRRHTATLVSTAITSSKRGLKMKHNLTTTRTCYFLHKEGCKQVLHVLLREPSLLQGCLSSTFGGINIDYL